ncbi:protein CHAPERONE-LIKE PROTEIN OF POR1, chloroplastic isoform X2 [Phalaenopsis equestris]|nr:protein CHAPERONE-LIKE PROTEIN OF POR1, chloroplastic isoform X2 [Phalaenopsis equestris]XP_020583126.1 protein CHAPERONE-LIKE PROTEIN OF POR1, chloroplastic isoform X2 [Phalaenopsis equestris]XP_020583127.1 protein CHAPERONE-LIKE PROTEIN OF POR1, chloroplastic isoform X2 [Phalaenopsis equestris]XP_020583128.1 protein CHAPERONE-LIKE PROTEIN OF POR1, chloroplastic isoform X2 [Phalaenopsis equestris]
MMSIAGLTCSRSSFSCCTTCFTCPSSACSLTLSSIYKERLKEKRNFLLMRNRKHRNMPLQRGLNTRRKNEIYASFGDMADNSTGIFPRIRIKDPYERLGISKEASEEEIQAARNFLINKYAGHKPSVDAIESAHDRIIMQSFYDRKNPKINIKKKVREVTQSQYVKAITSRFQTPATRIILKTSIAFVALGLLTVLFPTEEGPTLQVAISLILSIYFIYERLRNRVKACLYGIGAFFLSWLLGTFLMVSVMPPLLKGPRSLEVTTSLISYVLLWVSSTFLK